MRRVDGPDLLDVVEGAHFRPEQVNDHVARVDQHPVAVRQALDLDAAQTLFLEQTLQVVGQGAESARATLEAAGFRVDTLRVDGTAPEGQVVGQSTPAGQSQLKGATITLQVSAGNRFEMPNIVGDTVEEALAKLEQAGWRGGRGQLVELPQNDPDLSRVGRIYSQQPPVGEAGVNDQVVVRVIRFDLVPGPG